MALPPATRAVITGAASGLGRAIALELAQRGGRMLLVDVDEAGLAESVALVTERGGSAWPVVCDVRQRDAVLALADEAEARMGGADLLVNNAGVALGGPFDEIAQDDWQWIVDINLWGVIYGCQAFVPRMKAQGSGFILNVSSAAGLLSPPMMAPYNVTKAAVVALSETLHGELADDGIRVTVLCPTFFVTNLIENSALGASGDDADYEEDPLSKTAKKLMARSKVQAPDVAAHALDAVGRGDTYALPMRDGRIFWRLKRALPNKFSAVTAAYRRRLMKKAEARRATRQPS